MRECGRTSNKIDKTTKSVSLKKIMCQIEGVEKMEIRDTREVLKNEEDLFLDHCVVVHE